MRLYEVHLPVSDLDRSIQFYEQIVGWKLVSRIDPRNIAFLMTDDPTETMLGLWGPGSVYGEMSKHHTAFLVDLEELFRLHRLLPQRGSAVNGFNGEKDEPSVIGWMPTAQFYFEDPDGHSIEFIAHVEGPADASFVGSYSVWVGRLT